MIHFTPTLGIKDTAKNVNGFIKENHFDFINLLKMVAPYLAITLLISILFQHMAMQELTENLKNADLESEKANLDQISLSGKYEFLAIAIQAMMGYFFAVIAISWHRLVLLGSKNYQPMNMFKPKRSEIHFIALAMLTSIVAPLLLELIVHKTTILNPAYGLVGITLAIAYIYFTYKICFLFPSFAVNSNLSIKDSFRLTKGYFWKMGFAYILAILKIILIVCILFFALSILTAVLIMPFLNNVENAESLIGLTIMQLVIGIPLVMYFSPLLTIIFVTVLSNYYQHALQNKGLVDND